MKDPYPLVALDTLLENEPQSAFCDSTELVVIKTELGVSVLQGNCPHQGASLSEGTVREGKLQCALHGWVFDTQTGAHFANPRVCLKRFETHVQGNQLFIDREEVRGWKASTRPKMVKRTLDDLPGPKGWPLVGNHFEAGTAPFHQVIYKWYDTYQSDFFRFKLGPKTFVATGEAALIQEILVNRPAGFRRISRIESSFTELGVSGVFSSEGKTWIKQRRLTMPAFNSSHLKDFYGSLCMINERLYRRWKTKAEKSESLEVQRELMRFTVDITTLLAFGVDMNTIENEGGVVQDHLSKIFPRISERLKAPFPRWRYFKLPRDRELDRALSSVKKTVQDIIEKTREKLKNNPRLQEHPSNFLEGFLAYRDEEGMGLSDAEILANVMTILIAGEDTTANAIAWLMHHLTLYPQVQDKAREEVDRVLGKELLPLTYADIEKLTYLDAVINESMRVNPVAPFMFMEPLQKIELRGLKIPKGIPIVTVIGRSAMSEKNFSRPDEFLPERWLENSDLPVHNPKASMPFGAGPRFCPGRNLAWLEIKAVMAMVLKNFILKKDSQGRQMQEVFDFVVIPKNLWIQFESRK